MLELFDSTAQACKTSACLAAHITMHMERSNFQLVRSVSRESKLRRTVRCNGWRGTAELHYVWNNGTAQALHLMQTGVLLWHQVPEAGDLGRPMKYFQVFIQGFTSQGSSLLPSLSSPFLPGSLPHMGYGPGLQDLSRHRQEDGCGKASSGGSTTCCQNISTEPEKPRETPYPPSQLAAQGPRCLRCGLPGEDIYAEVAARSIFGSPDCKHGPYCASCAEALRRLTLGFCSGCNALIRAMLPPSPAKEQGEPINVKVDMLDMMSLD